MGEVPVTNVAIGETKGATGSTFSDFQANRYFPGLQQLRTLSVLAVIGYQMQDPMWKGFPGDVGVTIFFLVSGFPLRPSCCAKRAGMEKSP